MQFVIILFSLLCVLFSYNKEKNIFNPMTLFFSYWLIVISLASLELYDIYSISQQAYFIIAIGMFSFACGYSITLKTPAFITYNNSKPNSKYTVRYKPFIIINIFIIIFLLLRLIDVINLLNQGYSWWLIRLMVTSVEKDLALWGGSELNLYIYTYLVSPFVYLAVPTAIIDYFIEKKSRLFVLTTLIVMVLFSIVTVSRNILVFSIIYFIFTSIIYGKQLNLSEKIKKRLKKTPIIIILPITGIAVITLLRKADANFLKEAYVYLAGAIPSLSIRLTESFAEIRTYGFLTTRGFTRIFYIILDKIGIDYPENYHKAQDILDNLELFIPIGKDIKMNAYATLFYHFYIDGGILGVIILSMLLGYIFRKAYQGIKYNINIRNAVFYLLLLQQLLFSVARIYTVYPTRALPFLLILFMFTKVTTKTTPEEK